MLSRFRLSALLSALAALAAGCVSNSAPLDSYQSPPAGAPVAYLKGSQVTEAGLFGSDHTGFVALVDLKPVYDAQSNWSGPIALTPGKHTIVGEYRYSNFMARAYLPLDAKAGVTYQLMIKNGAEPPPSTHLYCDFWIVDQSTMTSVTQVYRQQATGGKKGTVFNVPY